MSGRTTVERSIAYVLLGGTLFAIAGSTAHLCWLVIHTTTAHSMIEDCCFGLITSALIYGNVVYQLARIGELKRESDLRRVEDDHLDRFYAGPAPSLTVLIPSYKEDPEVLRQTLLSAALLEYPGRRVAVLIDDPPGHAGGSWSVIEQTGDFLARSSAPFTQALHEFERRSAAGNINAGSEAERLAALYENVAEILEGIRTSCSAEREEFVHVDELFRTRILLGPATSHRARAAELRAAPLSAHRIGLEYRRLATFLRVEISGFERKRWLNLSHEPNKAMNLNSYIGLIGRALKIVEGDAGRLLVDAGAEEPDLVIPDSEFLLTLDADSLIDGRYALRLVAIMLSNKQIAVAQTPYSAIPGARNLVERVAGATTDIQYVTHQGYVRFGAAYWVGANAVLRLAALRDIRTLDTERSYEIQRFIQDRTVIEDTGSTIDLVRKGWSVYNHRERLAYSATPPDFGSLVIQRQRWSNGGIIILPDLLGYFLSNVGTASAWSELFVRAHYLLSPALGGVGMVTLLLYPFDPALASFWLPLTAGPYYFAYGRDLVRCGYGWIDLFRVYALNLLLLPVSIAGVLLSLRQAITGKKSPFGRTPKVANRTATAPVYILVNGFLAAFLCFGSWSDFAAGRYERALFCGINAAFFLYGFHGYIGWRESWVDLNIPLRRLLAYAQNRGREAIKQRPVGTSTWFDAAE